MTDQKLRFPPKGVWPLLRVTRDWSCPGGGVHEWDGEQVTGADGWTLAVATRCGKCPAMRMEMIHA